MEIRSEKFNPYFIRWDGLNWTVFKEMTVQEKDKKGEVNSKAGTVYESAQAYCSTKDRAKRWIADHRFADTPGVFTDEDADKLEAEILNEVMQVDL